MPQFESAAGEDVSRSPRGVRGSVRSVAGSAVASATVRVTRFRAVPISGEWTPGVEGRSGSDGRFELTIPPEWELDPVAVTAAGPDGNEATPVPHVLSPRTEQVDLVLVAMGVLEGRVDGVPPEGGAWVEAWGDLFVEAPGMRRVAVGADGTFRLTGLRDTVVVQAGSPGRVRSSPWSGTFAAPYRRETVRLTLGAPSVDASLVVLGPDDRPLTEGSHVRAGSEGELTRAFPVGRGGVVRVDGLDPARRLVVGAETLRDGEGPWWALPTEVRLDAAAWRGPETTVVRFVAGANPRFRVTSDDGGPAARLGLTLTQEPSDASGVVVRRGATDDDGAWTPSRVAPLPPGRYVLVASSRAVLWEGDLPGRRQVMPIDVPLGGLRSLDLLVTDDVGNPVTSRDLHVALFTPTLGGRDGRVRQVDGAELGADGTARLWCDGGALDEARLRVGFGEAYREFSVAAARAAGSSGVLHLRIPSDFLGKVRVRVELPSRLPLRDARVVIEGTVRSYDLIAGADGVAAHPWVIAGSYRVSVLFGRDEPVVEADLVVVPGRETDIVLVANP